LDDAGLDLTVIPESAQLTAMAPDFLIPDLRHRIARLDAKIECLCQSLASPTPAPFNSSVNCYSCPRRCRLDGETL